ncbi:MAG: aminotransferase class III-fold pyridoxal phosphate-dependent enzyme, partial [Thermoanaerobaculia bacterium]
GPRLEGVVKPGHHGTTFGGNPLACRLGIAVLDEIHDQRLLEKISALGTWLEGELTALHARCGAVVDVRGRGLMWGIEIDRPAGPIAGELLDRGFIVGTARENVIRLLPPYIVPKKALVELIDALDDILSNEKEIHQ